jgi:hypothetical protein
LNREPGAFPDPDPRPVHRIHEPAHIRASTLCAAHVDPAPQARKSLPQMNADKLVSRVRDWLNARVSHRHICVHLRQKYFSS